MDGQTVCVPIRKYIMTPKQKTEYIQNRANWQPAQPRKMPRPTYWPFFLAMGLAFLFWGLLTNWMIGAAGLIILGIALTGWITDLRHERRENKD